MNISIKLTGPDEAYIIKNMYPLYLHDLSGHYGLVEGHLPNRHGIFEDTDEYRTLADQYDVQNIWWDKPGILYPFLIQADAMPAGFALIATPPHCAQGVDYFVNDFFLLQPFRGKGIAEKAAVNVFEQFRGEWELFTNPAAKNITGQKFWRKTVSRYTQGRYSERTGETLTAISLPSGSIIRTQPRTKPTAKRLIRRTYLQSASSTCKDSRQNRQVNLPGILSRPCLHNHVHRFRLIEQIAAEILYKAFMGARAER